MSADFTMDFDVNSFVMARRTFYNDSAFDGGDSAAGPGDDAAIAADKTAALPGQALGFSNATSYSRGITGIMVDVRSLPAGIGRTVTPDDFEFVADVSGQPSGWAVAPAPESVTVRRGDGVFNHSDRITAIWPDGAVKNESLQVTLKANADTGLTAADVFFFGNLVGEAGDGISLLRVSALDLAAVKRALNTDSDVTGRYDFNRDGRVNAIDLAAVRSNLNRSLPGIAAAAAPALASTAPAVPEPSLLRMAEVGDEESDNILS